MDSIRILHTGDVHIGAPFEFLGERGAEQRRTVRETFERVTRIAGENGYGVLLVAGDLFDDAYAVPERDVAFAIRCLAAAGPACRVVILPGSHDYWAPGSVYERERDRFEGAGNVSILTPERRVVTFPDLSLAVHGNPLTSPHEAANLVAGLVPEREMRWNVAMAHGSVAGASADHDPRENPIRLDELPPGFDYAALGHWHSYNVVRAAGPPVVYSGSPELIARDQTGAGSVVSVTFSGEAASIERIAVGRRHIEAVTIDCTGIGSTEQLVARILERAAADSDLVLDVAPSGVLEGGAVIDPELALEMLVERYFSVRFTGEVHAREISRDVILAVPEGTVAGSFVRLLLERIDRAEGDERRCLEEALQIGYQLFQGRNLLR
ncbi:MAG TPA: DNA repair exonuclease [Patescibacteria group bacterium]|nr:DNA repair exonuclease [Patescibacteria group bacterium]